MKTKFLNVYNDNVEASVDNEYPTSEDAFRQPCLQYIVGQRTAGKSFLTSKMLAQAKRDKTFDIVYIITPSFNSNKSYFQKYVAQENVFEPTKMSIQAVICRVEQDRDDWEQFLAMKEMYKKFQEEIKRIGNRELCYDDPERLLGYLDMGFLDGAPKWKYEKEEPPKSLLVLDDCLGSPAIMNSSGLTRIATLNRHIAPLEEDHVDAKNGHVRSACGLAVIILSQSYKYQQGISRILRENCSILTLFKNKQEKQLMAIKEELANVVDVELFDKAYAFAVREKFGNLSVDFKPKCPSKTFRKNLKEIICFEELPCECHLKKEN
jgi:hypothetical protein